MRANCIHKPILDPQYSLHLSLVLAKDDAERARALRATALWHVALHGTDGLETPPFYTKKRQQAKA